MTYREFQIVIVSVSNLVLMKSPINLFPLPILFLFFQIWISCIHIHFIVVLRQMFDWTGNFITVRVKNEHFLFTSKFCTIRYMIAWLLIFVCLVISYRLPCRICLFRLFQSFHPLIKRLCVWVLDLSLLTDFEIGFRISRKLRLI